MGRGAYDKSNMDPALLPKNKDKDIPDLSKPTIDPKAILLPGGKVVPAGCIVLPEGFYPNPEYGSTASFGRVLYNPSNDMVLLRAPLYPDAPPNCWGPRGKFTPSKGDKSARELQEERNPPLKAVPVTFEPVKMATKRKTRPKVWSAPAQAALLNAVAVPAMEAAAPSTPPAELGKVEEAVPLRYTESPPQWQGFSEGSVKASPSEELPSLDWGHWSPATSRTSTMDSYDQPMVGGEQTYYSNDQFGNQDSKGYPGQFGLGLYDDTLGTAMVLPNGAPLFPGTAMMSDGSIVKADNLDSMYAPQYINNGYVVPMSAPHDGTTFV